MELTEKLINLIQDYKTKKKAGESSWVYGLIIGIIALIILVYVSYNAWVAGKERAKLLHEKAVKEEEAHQAEVTLELSKLEEDQKEALKSVEELSKEVEELDRATTALEEERIRNREIINKISSWDDVDAYIR